ncbi:MAG: hypothetical protein EP344_11310 [Bacteroidetes bacterium]|nr:MAG: hypothetical protein EP344_11310 [Bacteroidota bacterium]
MPIEIKELVIKVTVSEDRSANNRSAGNGEQSARRKKGGAKERNDLVAECVEQVLQILQSKNER